MSQHSFAAEIIVYKGAESYKDRQVLKLVSSISSIPSNQFKLSKNDLNNDFIDEYIVKPLNCNEKLFCPHYVAALKKQKPILLLETQAYKLLISDQSIYGVRNLNVFDKKQNEFQSTRYEWNPFSYLYEQKE